MTMAGRNESAVINARTCRGQAVLLRAIPRGLDGHRRHGVLCQRGPGVKQRDQQADQHSVCHNKPLVFFMFAHQLTQLLRKYLRLLLIQWLFETVEKIDLLRVTPTSSCCSPTLTTSSFSL